jgi:LysR family transcriptional regulator, low CO2-responsive transcriptional regulator
VAPSAQVWDLIGAHEVDLIIAGAPPSGADANVVATKPNELIVVAAPPIAAAFDWMHTPWLLREQGSATRTRVESYLKAQRVAPPRLVLGSNGAVVAGAVAELGCALISRDAIAGELADGRLVQLSVPGMPMRRPWHAVVGSYSGAATWLFVQHLRSSGWRSPGARGAVSPVPAPHGGRNGGEPRRPRTRVSAGGVDGPAAVEGGL